MLPGAFLHVPCALWLSLLLEQTGQVLREIQDARGTVSKRLLDNPEDGQLGRASMRQVMV
ncbi:hypothetical protein BRAS3843_1910005 [Bradyrhizobium sp. STM 3843]|nr:hypothetical protein BRAS3843_1910005 [Bradyrhizobium sp. STM 3843]